MALQFTNGLLHNFSSLNCTELSNLKRHWSREVGCSTNPRGHSQLLCQDFQLAVLTAESLADDPVVHLRLVEYRGGPFYQHGARVNDRHRVVIVVCRSPFHFFLCLLHFIATRVI